MFNRRTVTAGLAAMGATLVLTACGKKEEAPTVTGSITLAPAPEVDVGKWAELRVAVDLTYKPFAFKTETGEPAGFDVDIAKSLCDEIKAKCVFVEQTWDGMIPGLQANKYDAIISSMPITPERLEQIDFTHKYYSAPSCVVVKTALNLDGTPASYKGKKLGVVKASAQERYAKGELEGAGAKIVSYDAQDKVYLDIKAGRLDGTVADVVDVGAGFLSAPEGQNYSCSGPTKRIAAQFDAKYFGVGVGVGVRKADTELKDALNQAIDAIRASGKWQDLAHKYVPGVDIWGQSSWAQPRSCALWQPCAQA